MATIWNGGSYGRGHIFSSEPAGADGVFVNARLEPPPSTGLILTRKQIPGRSPTGHIVLDDREIAEKLCNLLNQHGTGKSFAVIGNLEVDNDLNVS